MLPAGADPLRLGDDKAVTLPAIAFPPSPPRFGKPDGGEEPGPSGSEESEVGRICRLIAENADAVGMPRDFFARLIWKESRFDAKALSPVGAQGIAQFMPYTAAERGLDDPFDSAEAIRHSALYLADLRSELGNWGLAAAAYNGGINRVKRWIASGGRLPYETESYVLSIAFHPAEWFQEDGREIEPHPLEDGKDFAESCRRLPIIESRSVFASLDTGAPMKPWGVQVAGNPSQSIAMAAFRRVQAAYPSVIGDTKPLVLRERAPGIGRIYAVRIGADTRGEANQLCVKLKRAGGSCIVMKNR
ncbi:lytic transglycosylase domain-containing protein [Jiella endophytica]|uniref:Lytic transglycosylase domain-containing protein n=1 Tax=Jiella endophytica TaxID=2558362 RepID=A0A4Y8RPS5_9HYPH|nr:lytic transglycosylase domain-containing protein [Jiella endophytica]TFF25065.1 lytic transglycosylase domain-containing protein [Jiella endophytica]